MVMFPIFQEYYVDYLYILGRKDCCGDRLDGAVITMDNKTVAGIKYSSGQTTWTIPMNNAKGRRFRLTLLNEYLTICEFAIYGRFMVVVGSWVVICSNNPPLTTLH